MATEKTEAYEYKHLECPQTWLNAIIQQYAMFYWELVGTQTIVSKESHLERGGLFDSDTIYSVSTTERFATIDLKRNRNIPNIDEIKRTENSYFSICNSLISIGCSPIDNYNSPPPQKSIGCLGLLLYLFYILPGVLYSKKVKEENEKNLLAYQQLKVKLDSLIADNKQLLNV